MALILRPEDSKAWTIPTGSRLCSTASPPRRKTKTKLPVFPYQALLNNVSLLGPIKQECRSQIKPEATEKTNPAGGLAHPPPQGGLIFKKKLGFLSLSLSHLPSSSSSPQIHPLRESREPWEGCLPLRGEETEGEG